MQTAINISRYMLGKTDSNPAVGCIIAANIDNCDVIIGKGTTSYGGRPHAETQAIENVIENGYDFDILSRSVIYVTLEPCAHYGFTSPCCERIIAAKIPRAVIALLDIDPRVHNKGRLLMQQAGIKVDIGCLALQAFAVLSSYYVNRMHNRSAVTLKLALGKSQFMGQRNFANFRISNELAKKSSHNLRAYYDAILVSINTVLCDDPLLNCRLPGYEVQDSPIRLVLDRDLKIALDSRLVKTAQQYPLWIICDITADSKKKTALEKFGVKIIEFRSKNNLFELYDILHNLYKLGIYSILVEAGAFTAKEFIRQDLVDAYVLYRSNIEPADKNAAIYLDTEINLKDYFCAEKMHLRDNIFEQWVRKKDVYRYNH